MPFTSDKPFIRRHGPKCWFLAWLDLRYGFCYRRFFSWGLAWRHLRLLYLHGRIWRPLVGLSRGVAVTKLTLRAYTF